MRRWTLQVDDPYTLPLAADQRFTTLDYANDQIWELLLGSGDPDAILLQTSFGLRARNMRIFPRFSEGDVAISGLRSFDAPPTIHQFYSNYVNLSCSPFPGIDVVLEYWAPDSHMIAGRIHIANNGVTSRSIQLSLVALLNPSGDEAQAMLPEKQAAVRILQGRTANLAPVLFMTGGAQGHTSPFSALVNDLEMLPGASRRFTWALGVFEDWDTSFEEARKLATRNWDAEIAKIEVMNGNDVEIETGDPDWDATLAAAQNVAYSLMYSPSADLPYPTFVSTRQPDQGYSFRGDGSDYNHLWNGQAALEAWYLSGVLLPGQVEVAKGLFRNFVVVQKDNGHIDWKPGLAGQRGNMTCPPLLASLVWRIYQHEGDLAFLDEAFVPLLDFVNHWFTDRHDRDGDGIPEWDNAIHSGFDDNPSFATWHAWSQGADITFVESPDLCAYLYRECALLIKMAQLLERAEATRALEALQENLALALEAAWDGRSATYRYWDRETHQAQRGEKLGVQKGAGQLLLDMVFELPQRLHVRVNVDADRLSDTEITVHGHLANGQHRVERIGRANLNWTDGSGAMTLRQLYADLEHVQAVGLPEKGNLAIEIVDLRQEDHTLLTPLWAGSSPKQVVEKMLSRKLSKPTQYYGAYGIPACPKPPKDIGAEMCVHVWLPWNVMVAEGLLAYGYREEAADLMIRLTTGIVANLKRQHVFRKHYHAKELKSMGERNALFGLPPIGLFMEILGIRIQSPWKVEVLGQNPYPWPVRLRYRGLVIDSAKEEILITFPDGQVAEVSGPFPCVVENNLVEAS